MRAFLSAHKFPFQWTKATITAEAHTSKQNIRFYIINKKKKMNDENDRSIKFVRNVERS